VRSQHHFARIAELALTPGICAQDGFLTTHLIESLMLPERELIAEYLGRPDDIIDTPTPAQRILFGAQRRRIPELWTVDNPVMIGTVQNQDAYMQSVAAQRPFFFDHIAGITDKVPWMSSIELTGRRYRRVSTYRTEDAEYLILGQGSMMVTAEAVADYLRETRKIKVGVVNLTMFRPFPAICWRILKGRKGVTCWSAWINRWRWICRWRAKFARRSGAARRTAASPMDTCRIPIMRPTKNRTTCPRCIPDRSAWAAAICNPKESSARSRTCCRPAAKKKFFYLSIDFIHDRAFTPKQEIHQIQIADGYPIWLKELAVHGSENPNLMPKNSITVRLHSVGGWGAITTGKNLAMTLFDLLGYHIKANPKYGSEKKGQPTTYYLSAAPEPIRINCDYFYVDVVLSPDPNVFQHSNPLAGLKKGGVFVLQSAHEKPRRGLGGRFPSASSASLSRTRSGLLPGRVQDRARRGDRSGTAVPHAGQCLPGRLLRGVAGDEPSRS
jgi:pyruvate-ferredoxin/flavodoxin oxidoreductase